MMKKLLALTALVLLTLSAHAQQYVDARGAPLGQMNWPKITGAGTPTALGLSCTFTNYGQPYQNLTPNPNTTFHCGAFGWQQDATGGGGGTTTYPVTFAASGGASPGNTFNGSVALTVDYHTLGAQLAYGNLSSIGALANGAGWLHNNGGGAFTYSSPTPSGIGAEPALGNPSVSGYVLTSTTGGFRSWTPQTSGGSYPGAGIASSTGSAWTTSYGIFGSGSVLLGSAPVGTAAYQAVAYFEPALGNPSTNGYVLSSTTAGVRSWVANTGGTVTSLAAPSGSWPTWLVPTVTNSTTTPSLAVAASAIPNAALAYAATTVNGQTCTLGSTCTISASAGSITVGTTSVLAGTNGDIEYNNSGVLGELGTTGSGSVVRATSPTLVTPILGTPTSINIVNATGMTSGQVTAALTYTPANCMAGTTGSDCLQLSSGLVPVGNIPAGIPIASVGSAGLSGTSPITISSAGVIACPTCDTAGATVSSFSAGSLSPLFTTSVATATTTPSLTFSLSNAAQNSIFAGPPTGGAGTPSYQTAPTFSAANLTNFPTFNQNTTGTAANITATSNSSLTTLSSLSLPWSQISSKPTIATVATTSNLLEGDGAGNAISAGIAASNVPLLNATNVFTELQTININATAPPAVVSSGTVLHLVGVDGTAVQEQIDGFGQPAQVILRRAQGTNASPTALTAGNSIGSLSFTGYDGTAWGGNSAGYYAIAFNNWTTSDHSSYLRFYTTPGGSTTLAEVARISDTGGLSVGNATFNATDPGQGNIAAQNGFLSANLSSYSGNLASIGSGGALGNSGIAASNVFQLPSLTACSVLFSNGSTISQDNANFCWDSTHHWLGLGTAAPAVNLDIRGAYTDFSGGAGGFGSLVDIFSNSTAAKDAGGELAIGGNTGNAVASYPFGGFKAAKESTAGDGNYNGYLSFYTSSASGLFPERMRISGTGGVSIGDTAAAAMFNVGTANQFQVNSSGVMNAATGSTVNSIGIVLADGTNASALSVASALNVQCYAATTCPNNDVWQAPWTTYTSLALSANLGATDTVAYVTSVTGVPATGHIVTTAREELSYTSVTGGGSPSLNGLVRGLHGTTPAAITTSVGQIFGVASEISASATSAVTWMSANYPQIALGGPVNPGIGSSTWINGYVSGNGPNESQSYRIIGTLPATSAGQIGLGNNTAAASNCNQGGALTSVAGCWVIGVAGRTSYVPYF